ncbi:MAG: permease [Anaerolineae bacterium]|nr:permease [Anaerolineae bacterium]
MLNVLLYVINLLQTGLGSLAAYLAAHVLLCLLPAFFIAGALAALIPKEAITRYLGRDAPKWISYPASALGGFVLAVCSCTIMPLFASIYKKGAGLGPAITFLFVGPAINILAISFTGVQIGMDIALARIILSIVFGVGIGLLMAFFFHKDDEAHTNETNGSRAFAQNAANAAHSTVPVTTWVFFVLLLGVLIAGTLQIGLLTNSYATFNLPGAWANGFQGWLDGIVPPNASLGIEGVSVHGVLLIALLIAIGVAAWFGLNNVDEGFNTWTYVALGLVTLTLLVASFKVVATDAGLSVGFTGKLIAEIVLIGAVWWMAVKFFEAYAVQEWLWEMWRFVKQIIPLLIVGVFLAGMARAIIPATWIQAIAGRNTWWANLVGVLFGVFMYFPTLVEVPIAQTFLSLGMHRGPLLAYLLADPELSLQSILITNSVIGKGKTAVYVVLVTIFSTLSGLLFGAWVNGTNTWLIVGGTVAGIAAIAVVSAFLNSRSKQRKAVIVESH